MVKGGERRGVNELSRSGVCIPHTGRKAVTAKRSLGGEALTVMVGVNGSG